MFVLLSIIPFILLFLIFESKEQHWQNWQQSFLSAAISWACILTTTTESLSLISQANFSGYLTAWLFSSSILAVIYWRIAFRKVGFKQKILNLMHLKQLRQIPPFFTVSWISLILIVALIGLVAVVAPPNNWDSMTYHMSRVVNWMQNQNVAHYPTHIVRQLDSSPWAEFAILQLQVLSGGDRFANLVQWFSMIGSLVGVSLIAKQLGASPVGQMLSSLVCLSLPMGLLQASSTQNDYVVSFWLICFASNVLLAVSQPIGFRVSLELGASLGLAVLTKATAYFYAFPFCILLAIGLIRFFRWRVWQPSSVIIFSFLLINIGFWWRNFKLFGDPLGGSTSALNYRNQLLTVSGLVSNLVRNIALHLATPYQPLNDVIERLILGLHHFMGLEIDDLRTTFLQQPFQIPIAAKNQPIFLHEDISGNPIHLVLLVISLLLYLRYRNLRAPLKTGYLVVVIGTFLCLSFLLTWQPWASRLHLPFFVLLSPFIGTVFTQSFNNRIINYILTIILITSSVPYLLFNASRPLAQSHRFTLLTHENIFVVDRATQYFINRPDLKESYTKAIEFLKARKCSKVGLYIGGDSWEYPFWVLANQTSYNNENQESRTLFQHVKVNNASASSISAQPSLKFAPCAIVSVDTLPESQLQVPILRKNSVKETIYTQVWNSKPVYIYRRKKHNT